MWWHSAQSDSHVQRREARFWNCELSWMVFVFIINSGSLYSCSFYWRPWVSMKSSSNALRTIIDVKVANDDFEETVIFVVELSSSAYKNCLCHSLMLSLHINACSLHIKILRWSRPALIHIFSVANVRFGCFCLKQWMILTNLVSKKRQTPSNLLLSHFSKNRFSPVRRWSWRKVSSCLGQSNDVVY